MEIKDTNPNLLFKVKIAVYISDELVPVDTKSYEIINDYIQKKVNYYGEMIKKDIHNELGHYEWRDIPTEESTVVYLQHTDNASN